MLFNSIIFCIFLLVVVPLFYVVSSKYRKYFLILVSYIFYGYWDYRFLILIAISTIVDFIVGKRMYQATDKQQKRKLLRISLFVNLSILGFFKYFNFFTDSFQEMLSVFGLQLDFVHLNIILPVGISFYTFQTLSYTFDIFRKEIKPVDDFWDFALFVCFFPQLVAGPIERAVNLIPQLQKLSAATWQQIKEGLSLITIGMFKKVLIGDTCGRYVDHIYAEPQIYHADELIFALLMFSIQIYADFSGYSTIARGTAKLFGVNLMHNFNQPYLSSNITEFWRRWHISLSSWLKEYLYIFWLGGNRINETRTRINLMATMLLGGLWHGASWNFVIWGGIHGLALSIHKFMLGNKKPTVKFVYKTPKQSMLYLTKVLGTFLIVLIAWLFFRIPDLSTTILILGKIITFDSSAVLGRLIFIGLAYFIVTITIDAIEYKTQRKDFLNLLNPATNIGISVATWFCVISYLLTIGKPMPFIYFQF